MKLSRKDYEFINPLICHIQPKHIDLDRVLIGLYTLLKYNGRRPAPRTGRQEVDVDYLTRQLIEQHGDTLQGFRTHESIVSDWVYSDLVDMVFRGHPDKERVASPRPLHLNAYKLRNLRYSRDYGASEHIFSMMRAVDSSLVERLALFLGKGMDAGNQDTYDGVTPLDLDTLMIVRMIDDPLLQEKRSSEGNLLEPPLCYGHAKLLCSDVRRLLAYEGVVPRPVLIDYLRSAFGLHLGLYLMRLFSQLSGWAADKTAHPTCQNCPVEPDQLETPFAVCPYAFQCVEGVNPYRQLELIVDMGEDYSSHMAQLSRENCTRHYGRINDYIQAVLTVNQLFQFVKSTAGRRHLGSWPETVPGVLQVLHMPSQGMEYYFAERIDNILPESEMESEKEEIRAVKRMQGMSSLETFVELVALDRSQYYREQLTRQLDSVLMKNRDTGLLRQGKGKSNGRRWHMGSRLLEIFVQIAVLEPVGRGAGTGFRSRPILVDDFIQWLQARYGLVLAPNWTDATIQDYNAFNGNLKNLKTRLREIGFYTDLSDAYNAQVIRPRYSIETEATR